MNKFEGKEEWVVWWFKRADGFQRKEITEIKKRRGENKRGKEK